MKTTDYPAELFLGPALIYVSRKALAYRRHNEGVSYSDLSTEFNLHPSRINQLCNIAARLRIYNLFRAVRDAALCYCLDAAARAKAADKCYKATRYLANNSSGEVCRKATEAREAYERTRDKHPLAS